MVRPYNTKLFVEFSGSCCLLQSGKDANTILGMEHLLIGDGIITKCRTRTPRDCLVRWCDEDDVFRFGIHHPEDFLDVVGHLLEPFVALSKCGFSVLSERNVAEHGEVPAW